VRGGSILPIAPLTQSTAEVPTGPLTLRVFPSALKEAGEECAGEVYSDDGHTFAFREGAYARVHFSCRVAPDGTVSVNIEKQEGTWKPWWKAYRIEVVGWTPKEKRAALVEVGGRWGVTVDADADGQRVELR
jgi:alpha-glucosidase